MECSTGSREGMAGSVGRTWWPLIRGREGWNTAWGPLPPVTKCTACSPCSLFPLELCSSECWDDHFSVSISWPGRWKLLLSGEPWQEGISEGKFYFNCICSSCIFLPGDHFATVRSPQSFQYSPLEMLITFTIACSGRLKLPKGKSMSAMYTMYPQYWAQVAAQ